MNIEREFYFTDFIISELFNDELHGDEAVITEAELWVIFANYARKQRNDDGEVES